MFRYLKIIYNYVKLLGTLHNIINGIIDNFFDIAFNKIDFFHIIVYLSKISKENNRRLLYNNSINRKNNDLFEQKNKKLKNKIYKIGVKKHIKKTFKKKLTKKRKKKSRKKKQTGGNTLRKKEMFGLIRQLKN